MSVDTSATNSYLSNVGMKIPQLETFCFLFAMREHHLSFNPFVIYSLLITELLSIDIFIFKYLASVDPLLFSERECFILLQRSNEADKV